MVRILAHKICDKRRPITQNYTHFLIFDFFFSSLFSVSEPWSILSHRKEKFVQSFNPSARIYLGFVSHERLWGPHPARTPQEGSELSGTHLGVTANEQARELHTPRGGGRRQLPVTSQGIRTTLEGED